jgi:hypothetical protein
MQYNVASNDKRIKSYFEIVNTTKKPHVILPVIAMSDSGSMGSLTLPARKIAMLGLTPIEGKAGRTQIGGVVEGAVAWKLRFEPHVVVKFYFSRAGSSEIETREVPTFATCAEDEYKAYLNTVPPALNAVPEKAVEAAVLKEAASDEELPVTPIPVTETAPDASHGTPPATAIAMVTLSPTYHRPVELPKQQVALGTDVLAKLGVHADFARSVLWVEEELPFEDN